MKCPVCTDVRMREVEKDGVMIDICPDCKGVWLDRGELDKLMQGMRRIQDEYDRIEEQHYRGVDRQGDYPERGHAGSHQEREPYGYEKRGDDKYKEYDKYGRPKKKKSMFDMLGDIFD
ncbi:zf-TFIIB domain-containing protein [Paenibacillus sp. GCM10027626]|uniref:TFIIB-type zinc ribbon-containing protein n=1 Tax=Paenibacillus sp. GCM10027626 TaxID=3273411 RepID=UPI003643885B